MTDQFSELQQRLIRGFQAQLPHYDRALRMVAQPTLDPAGRTQNIQDLNAVLREIAALDAAMAADKSAWRSAGNRPGQQLRGLLDLVTERIRELSTMIDHRVAELQARKQALLPEVDECIQQRRMLNAYGKSR